MQLSREWAIGLTISGIGLASIGSFYAARSGSHTQAPSSPTVNRDETPQKPERTSQPQPVAAGPKLPAPGAPADDPKAEAAEDQVGDRLEETEKRFQKDAVDTKWADEAEQKYNAALTSALAGGGSAEVSCHGTMCRATIHSSSSNEFDSAFKKCFKGNEATLRGEFDQVDTVGAGPSKDGYQATLYIFRPGHGEFSYSFEAD